MSMPVIFSSTKLKCLHCSSDSDLSCNGTDVKECFEHDELCTTSYFIEKKGTEVLARWVKKGCRKPHDCTSSPITLSDSNEGATIAYGTVCCPKEQESCDAPTMETLIPTSKTVNNVTCKTCFSTSSFDCTAKEEMNCTGSEKKCGRLSMRKFGKTGFDRSMRGCATEDLCHYPMIALDDWDVITECSYGTSVHKLSFMLLASVIVSYTVLF
ncbi:phospholipase A2 inhibitor gamma subunit B-like isoform X2 [Hyperolius riggenbachi]|uniref:phospholipase A2 inhibitor gamma subunit B-like isoform X2 n=1 Tax=Hyperolius riggenbachi TaxID=752182 RepID=UPI0035A324B5